MGLLDRFKQIASGNRCDINQRFEVLREAISGTMSKCFKARDRRNDRIVAVKVLDKQKTAELEARFKGVKKPSEGSVAMALSHPNIVKTYEHGITTRGEQYLVMEFIEGPGLNSAIIGRDALLEGIRVELIRQIAAAIQAVHAAGYIHRDICPRNLMIDTQAGALKLIDFGLTVPATPEFMQPGNRTGTPNYMAPELVKRQRTDPRIDVFSFGVTAFELCTFELPWDRGSTGQAAMSHATHEPRDIRLARPKLNPQLAQAIMRCVERDPEKRPSLDQFLKMISKVQHEDVE